MSRGSKLNDEKERMNAIRRYKILDTQEEQEFDDIVELASQICETPIALLTLLDEDRQWFKAKKGINIKESSREIAFCAHTIEQDDLMIIQDTQTDDRFKENPFVISDPFMRFYAGMPLTTADGYKLGALSVADKIPRQLSKEQLDSLRRLGNQVIKLLTLRHSIIKLEESTEKISYLANLVEQTGDAIVSINDKLKILGWNKGAEILFGFRHTEAIGKSLSIIKKNISAKEKEIFASTDFVRVELLLQKRSGANICVLASITPIKNKENSITSRVLQFRDISDRKKLENDLHQTNKELQERVEEKTSEIRNIIERVSDAFIAFDHNFNLTYANKRARHILRNLKDDPEGKTIWKKFPEPIGATLKNICEKAMNDQEYSYKEIFDPIGKNWYESHIYPSPTGVSLHFHKITERKEAEESLRIAEERFRAIYENALVGIYQATVDGKFITLNPSMAKIFGYSSEKEMMEAVTNIGGQLFVNPNERLELRSAIAKHGLVKNFESRMIKKDKSIIWIQAQIKAIKNNKGEISYFEGIVKEITERKYAEEQIIKEKEFSEAIINSLPGIFYLFDTEGQFLRWNRNLEQVTGYSSEEITKMDPLDFFDEEEKPKIAQNIKKAFSEGMTEVEAHLLTKTGKKIPYYFNGWKAFFNNQLCLIGMGMDATEQKQSQEKLKLQFDELTKINHELDQFVYSVSHDLRAPLLSILGLTNVATLENPPPHVQKYFNMIQDRVNRLDLFIKNILDYSRNTRLELNIERVDFHHLIKDIEDHLLLIDEFENLDIQIRINENIPFYSDPMRLSIILNNLIVNAIKYQDFNKPHSWLKIYIKTSKTKALLKLEDNGIGIAKDQLVKIFNMFYRASTLSQGSGLGLYITQETIHKLGGSVSVDSQPGKYTVFEIELPNLEKRE